jgi:large subunit ribosomal protein L21
LPAFRWHPTACAGLILPKDFKMFAVIRTGGKQYKVASGDVFDVERLDGKEGAKLSFDVLLLGGKGKPKAGNPLVSGASVAAEIVAQKRAPKVIAFKKKRRKNTHRKRGHRQELTTVRITDIKAG